MPQPPPEVALCRQVSKTVGAKQFDLVTAKQLRRRGVTYSAIRSAIQAERLFEVHRGIYSLVPVKNMTVPARHYAAVLAGGTGAALCDESATWWLGLTRSMPPLIHVAVRRRRTAIPGIRWHVVRLREAETTIHNRMRVTTPARTALDYAATHSLWDTKGVLAELEYHYGIQAPTLTCCRGHPGSKRLARAIDEHTPQLARTHRKPSAGSCDSSPAAVWSCRMPTSCTARPTSTSSTSTSTSSSRSTTSAATPAIGGCCGTTAEISIGAGTARLRCATSRSSSSVRATWSKLIFALTASHELAREPQARQSRK